jgi:hypothetical protein
MRALDHVARRLAQWTRTSGDAALLLLDEAEDWAEGKAAVELLAAACRAIAFTPWWPGAARLHRRRTDRRIRLTAKSNRADAAAGVERGRESLEIGELQVGWAQPTGHPLS